MTPVSVVIICKNEVNAIGNTIKSVLSVSDDIVCADNGSSDGTQKVIIESGGRLIEIPWEGYGKTKSKGVAMAKHDWILTIDADEPIDTELQQSILQNDFGNPMVVYQLYFKTFLGDKQIQSQLHARGRARQAQLQKQGHRQKRQDLPQLLASQSR